MAAEAYTALVQRMYEEGINRQDTAAAAAFYTTDAKNHGRTVGREGMRKVFEALFTTFPDFHYRAQLPQFPHQGRPDQ